MNLRLKWTRTWADKPEDFICHAPEGMIGRIFSSIVPRTGEKEWHWSANGQVSDVMLTDRGIAATKQKAAAAVEAAYFRVKGEA